MTLTAQFASGCGMVRQLGKWFTAALLLMTTFLISACGGGDSSAPLDPVAVSVTAQPVSQTVVAGNTATFSVAATGDGITYQWQRSIDGAATWTAITGATASSYVIAAVDASMNAYAFRVLITGTVNAVPSSNAILMVTPAPTPVTITVQPANVTVIEAGSASFAVTTTGTAIVYQWQSSRDGTMWTNVAGATAATLTLNPVALTDSSKSLRVIVSNSVNTVASASALLTVTPLPTIPMITLQPSAASVAPPNMGTFTAAASGNPTPTYQWQVSTDNGVTFVDIAAATGASYTTPQTTLADTGKRFRLHAVNLEGGAFSNSALLTVAVSSAPVITVQPTDQSATLPSTATFSVTATGSPTPTYQWQQSTDAGLTFANINGATSTSYTTPPTVSADNNKRFQVIVTNSAGSVTSNRAKLTVNSGANPPGNGAAALCAPYNLPVGTTVQTVWVNSSNAALNSTGSSVNNGSVVFAGHAATELVVNTTLSTATLLAKIYGVFDATTGLTTGYGAVSRFTSTAANVVQDVSSVYTTPFVDVTYSLSVGQSVTAQTIMSTDTTTITTNGVVGTPVTAPATSSSQATTFVGFETITVPAGTFSTCRYLASTGITTWSLPVYATNVKDSQGGAATSITVNGVALTHN